MAGTENTGDDPKNTDGASTPSGQNVTSANTSRQSPQGGGRDAGPAGQGGNPAAKPGDDQYTGWDSAGQPHFGQMRDKYGPNYNPYKYGAPAPENTGNGNQGNAQNGRNQNQPNQNGNAAWGQANPGWGGNGSQNNPGNMAPGSGQNGQGPQGYQNGPYSPYGPSPMNGGYAPGYGPQGGAPAPNGNGYGYGPNPGNGYGPNGPYRNPQGGGNPPQDPNAPFTGPYTNPYNMPYGMQQFNPDDPNQNPVFGKWDWTAIFAFILSLTGYFCFIALPLGFFAYRREEVLHMKGKGFAIAAIVISILEIIGFIILLFNPDLLQSVLNLQGSTGSGSASTGLIQTLFLG
jgi:hypothetical protein